MVVPKMGLDPLLSEEETNRSILVKNIPSNATKEQLQIHFQRRENGGGKIDMVTMEQTAVVTFESPEVSRRVLQVKQELGGGVLQVERIKTEDCCEDEVFSSVTAQIDIGMLQMTIEEACDVMETIHAETGIHWHRASSALFITGSFTEIQYTRRCLKYLCEGRGPSNMPNELNSCSREQIPADEDSSSRKSNYLRTETLKSVSDQASTQSDMNLPRYQDSVQDPPENTMDSKEDKVHGGSQISATKICLSEISGLVADKYQTPQLTFCEFCSGDAPGFICESCFYMVCEKCQEMCMYSTCPCEKAKNHKFVSVQMDNKREPSQLRRPTDAPTESFKAWYCVRCTYVNPEESNVCIMCAKTRGVSNPEPPEPGSVMCRECTYCNKEGSDVCQICGKSLHFATAETHV